jgi:hypothetical protein
LLLLRGAAPLSAAAAAAAAGDGERSLIIHHISASVFEVLTYGTDGRALC